MEKTIRLIPTLMALATLILSAGCTPPATITSTVTVPATTIVVTIPASTPAVTATTTPYSQPTIVITYTSAFRLEPGSGTLLIVDMTIENMGYTSFNTNPGYFSAVVSNLNYSCDLAASDLKLVDLPYGGKFSGKLVFKVPAGTASSKVGYNLVYSGMRPYNILWKRMP